MTPQPAKEVGVFSEGHCLTPECAPVGSRWLIKTGDELPNGFGMGLAEVTVLEWSPYGGAVKLYSSALEAYYRVPTAAIAAEEDRGVWYEPPIIFEQLPETK